MKTTNQVPYSRGIVLVHEAFGVDEHVETMAARLAEAGFVVLAPDLYAREGGPPGNPAPPWTMDQVRAAVASLPDRRVLGDLEGALAHLASLPWVDGERLGAVGFCMGGNYAYMLGCTSRRLAAVVDFYGRFVYRELSPNKPIQPLELALNLSCPMLAIFGEDDPSIPGEDVERFRRTMDQFSRDVTVVTFPGVGHGFLNDRRKSYDRAAAESAWAAALDFLREHLGALALAAVVALGASGCRSLAERSYATRTAEAGAPTRAEERAAGAGNFVGSLVGFLAGARGDRGD